MRNVGVRMLKDSLGRPMRDLRISVTDRCNFRCTYCMPRDVFGAGHKFLDRRDLLSYEEITRLVGLFSRLGVVKIRLTGGEPLLRHDLPDLLASLSRIEPIEDIGLTTNGVLLTADYAAALRDAGLRRITLSLDALEESVFASINGLDQPVQPVLDAIGVALRSGFDPVKVNMVVMKGVNERQILPMVEYFRHSGVVLRFIEFMDVGNSNDWRPQQVFTGRHIIELIGSRYPLEAIDPNYPGEVAKRWRFCDGGGELGLINSVSQPFCGACSRIRLSAEGRLYTCLFATSGLDLLTPMRSGADDQTLAEMICALWEGRGDRYSEERSRQRSSREKIEMSYIGG